MTFPKRTRKRLKTVETKNSYKKSVAIFFSALFLTYTIVATWEFLQTNAGINIFLYFLVVGIPAAFIICLFIYTLYSLFVIFISKHFKSNSSRFFYYVISGSFLIALVFYLNWIYVRDQFYNFIEYLKGSNFYLVFSIIAVVMTIISAVKQDRRNGFLESEINLDKKSPN